MSNKAETLSTIFQMAFAITEDLNIWEMEIEEHEDTITCYEFLVGNRKLAITLYLQDPDRVEFEIFEREEVDGVIFFQLADAWEGLDDWHQRLSCILWEEREGLRKELQPVDTPESTQRKRL